MSTSEKIYYIKNGELFKIVGSSIEKAEFNENEHYSLLLDDSYFFYMSMSDVNASGRKLQNIVNVSLASKFPSETILKRGFIKINHCILIYIISEALSSLIASNKTIFMNADKISTPFIELSSKYQNFIFFDGSKYYNVKDNIITMSLDKNVEYITASTLIEEVVYIKNRITLPMIKSKSKLANYPYVFPISIVVICYIIFIVGNILSLHASNKVNTEYASMLKSLYNELGVSSSSDPYGMILYKAKKNTSNIDGGKNIIGIIEELSGDKILDNVTIKSFAYRDKVVRIEGSTTDYSTLEGFQKRMSGLIKQDVTFSDVKKDNSRILFSMRYNR